MPQKTIPSPVGVLCLSEAEGALTAIDWTTEPAPLETHASPLLREAAAQLAAYFARRLKAFDLPLAPSGTPFQQAVWRAMLTIPYRATASYGDLARRLGTAPRAVGAACGRNPIPIIIPCHRILAGGGRAGGYSGAGGLATKARLLALESAEESLFPELAPRPGPSARRSQQDDLKRRSL